MVRTTLRTFLSLSLLVGMAQAQEVDCDALASDPSTTLDDVLDAGCQPTAEQISRLMDNPVGELIMLPLQWDRTGIVEPFTGSTLEVDAVKLIPTIPLRGERWSLVNRLAVSFLDVPVNEQSQVVVRPEQPFFTEDDQGVTVVPGSTSGLGDIVYVGLFTPREPPKIRGGTLIWAFGPTLIAPTASEDVLGQGKWQLGPAAAVGYLGRKWTLGVLAQHWWSAGGDSDRASVSQSSIQYFWSRKLPNQWSLGASPTISLDWDDGAIDVEFPLGVGINKTVILGKLPARLHPGNKSLHRP